MSSVTQTFAGLQRTPLLDNQQNVSWQWIQGFNSLAQAVGTPALSGEVPTHSSSAGTPGQIATDGNYIYICGSSGLWSRAALSAF